MKKHIKINILVLTLALGLAGCEKRGFLDPPPVVITLDAQKTFSDENNTFKFLANCYAPLVGGLDDFGNGQNYAQLTDEAEAGPGYLQTNAVNFGSYDATNLIDNFYGQLYSNIRRANILIGNESLMTFNAATKTRFIAEARFLRAFYYFELVKRHGGIPLEIIAAPFEAIGTGDALKNYKSNLKRSSFGECVDFIVKELDLAAKDLPWAPLGDDERGRATSAACIALKAKMLLYAASKLYNNNSPSGSGAGGMTSSLIGYTAYDKNRWKLAADACREFFTKNMANGNWYMLYTGGYDKLFTESRDAANHELIWYRQNNSNGAIFSNPAGRLTGYAHNQVLVNLVDKYEMLNGKLKDETGSGYDEQQWWVNRDPRLAMTVLKNGDNFKVQNMAFWAPTPGVSAGADFADSYKSSIFFKKFQRIDNNEGVQKWHYIRLAEIYLMLAEAENEFNGPTAEAYQSLNTIRKRVGINMPEIQLGLNQDQLREKIRNERAVELALEAQRYFDVRRWMIAPKIDGGPVIGFKVTKENGIIKHTRYTIENRVFLDRMYFTPFPIDEIYKGTSLEQNPGY